MIKPNLKRKGGTMDKKKKSGMACLLRLAGKYKTHLTISAVFGALSALCSFIPYVMVYRTLLFLFNRNADVDITFRYSIIAAIAIVGKFVFAIISGTFSHLGAFNTLYNVRTRISQHIAKVNFGFFTNHTSGEIKKVIIEDVERMEKFLAHQIPDITSALCVPIIIFIYLLTVNVPMAVCLLSPVIIGLVIQSIAMAVTGKQMPIYHRLLGKLNSTIIQFINGMPVMKTYNMTAKSYREYSDTVTEYNEFWKKSTRDQGYTYGIFIALVESGILFALPVGGLLYFNGSLMAQDYLFFMVMSMVFLSSLLNLMNLAMMFNQIMSGVSRIQSIMDLPCATEGTAVLEKRRKYDVFYEHVTFRYDKADVLRNMNMNLPAGGITAFVGASGAGKTTAAQLIPKFWEVTDGSIRIDGKNITNLKTENLMDLVSFVFQETFMFNDSIYHNIAAGNQMAAQEHVEAAAKAAQIHDFIMSLPKGYDTKLGDDGIKLSGGEKQRVCIARAILKDAPIIIFDEATSYTDIENEHKIQLALANLLKGKTTIMIAHRLHTIVNANQICVFHQGQVEEVGTHQELIALKGRYSRMWASYVEGVTL
jgi:ATP-binding cassette subfamily B protein